jgi:dipeptidyl aminopeptidase/acylaminoacyl peptidase
MTIRASKFTPEVLLSAPRRSAGVPNADGSKVLYSVSTYSFTTHSKKAEIRILDVETQQTSLVTDDSSAGDAKWLGDDELVILFSGDDGVTTVKVGKAGGFLSSSYTAGTIEGPVGDLKIASIGQDEYALAVSGKATPDGDLFNPEKAKKPYTSGRLYNSMFVRHWDHYVTENKNALWVAKLSKNGDGSFELSTVVNALKGTGLESPIEPFGGTDHFDISISGLIFTAKDPDLNPALHTKTNIYLISAASNSFWSCDYHKEASLTKVEIYGFEGASTSPVFSPNGKSAAFLSMKTDGYESDKNQIFIIPDIRRPSWVIHALASKDGKGSWDRSPQAIIWNPDEGGPLYLIAEDHGRGCLFQAELYKEGPGLSQPKMIVKGGSISDVQPLKNGDLFISSTSLIDNSLYSLLPLTAREHIYTLPDDITAESLTTKFISSSTKNGAMFGLTRRQIDEVHWPGAAENTSVHAWVVKPSNFNSKKKYPLAYLIHGGPQGAWEDSWSTRWNPAVFAEQGYVVIAPNPTGSTGYGQDFTDAIQSQWGGLPYEDLVLGFEWIGKNLDYVNTDLAVALGASYGGYMMNWIQGHDLGREFKALVTHDGVFSMFGQMASEELYFPFHDINGPLWEKPKNWEQWDPSRHTVCPTFTSPFYVSHEFKLIDSRQTGQLHT